MSGRLSWPTIIDAAREWVSAQEYPVSLRQSFYRLVSTGLIPNTTNAYQRLSELTATARRGGEFPDYSDSTRAIRRQRSWAGVAEFAVDVPGWFGLDRTEGQPDQVIVGVEKRGMEAAALRLFSARGWRVIALGGFASTTITQQIGRLIEEDGRPSALIYAGDFDASGEDILRDFTTKVPFDQVVKAALTLDQVREFGLPENPGKATDSRSVAFAEKWAVDMQVEVDALDPAELDRLLTDAAAPFWDMSRFREVVARESAMRTRIRSALAS